jgi:hypothetical protein
MEVNETHIKVKEERFYYVLHFTVWSSAQYNSHSLK